MIILLGGNYLHLQELLFGSNIALTGEALWASAVEGHLMHLLAIMSLPLPFVPVFMATISNLKEVIKNKNSVIVMFRQTEK